MQDRITLKKKLTRAEFKRRAGEVLLSLQQEAAPFPVTTAAAKAERKRRSAEDPFYFFQTYLAHYFTSKFAAFHYELIELLDRRPGKDEVLTPVVVAAPREFAKTTITSFGYVLHQIVHKLRHFIIIGSDTEDLASDLTGYLYLELLYNERLRCDYGELVQPNWAVDDYVTLNDVRLKARGQGQRLRGLKHKQWRPDLVVLDDLENDQSVRSPSRVRATLEWIQNTVYPAIEASGSLFWIGTILKRRSALDTALRGEDEPWMHWTRRIYRALLENGSSLWPERHPVAQLMEQKRMMGSLAFNREKMNDPRDEEGVFREEWIRYYRPEQRPDAVLVAGAFDPSLETGSAADFKSIITLGLDWREPAIYVLDAYIKRSSLDQTIAAAYARHNIFGFMLFGVETNMFQRLLLREFNRAAVERRQYLPIRDIENKTAKESRIARLSPLVEKGLIRFQKGQGDQDLLIEQLLYFPSKTVHDDGPDALEMAERLLQQVARPGAAAYESVQKRRFEGRAGLVL